MLKGKTVVLGVTGSIAAYKTANLARMCKKEGADVHVLMTKNAVNFINPITFESLIGNKCLVDTFDRNFEYSVEHVALAKKADVVMIAPASANVIGKIACGIADDMLTTTVMACTCRKIISPAMNHNMYHNTIVQDNIKKLQKLDTEYTIVEPDRGMLANGDIGDGRMPDESVLFEYILRECAFEKTLAGKNVLVTAGATREPFDPVRFVSNYSTGKMGTAAARAAMLKGANVTLVAAHMEVEPPQFVNVVRVQTAEEMYNALMSEFGACDILIMAAAVADYRPRQAAAEKIKKSGDNLTVEFERTKDILEELGRRKENQYICGFSMETENTIENSKKKLEKKHLDMIAANNLRTEGAGFGVDTNVLTLITKDGITELPIMSKLEAASRLLNELKNYKWRVCQNENYRSITPPSRLLSQPCHLPYRGGNNSHNFKNNN
ncbi:MAG: bifunctional phosphopantothenoylcysteine decarboxylase/phosphopantothenate--cysteine ligase CoaBC [Clostridia bacterium]|nr:bifunctional phosphopantothenoylcysteine decarboxylase/phosphopantothenate--cysteine ligase CoaBC [Clostridia bacterium]